MSLLYFFICAGQMAYFGSRCPEIAGKMSFNDVQSQSETSEDESDEEDSVWDPQHATPWQTRQKAQRSRSASSDPSRFKTDLQVMFLPCLSNPPIAWMAACSSKHKLGSHHGVIM